MQEQALLVLFSLQIFANGCALAFIGAWTPAARGHNVKTIDNHVATVEMSGVR
jgi:hypothetical protein